jgi:hypothetical protein
MRTDAERQASIDAVDNGWTEASNEAGKETEARLREEREKRNAGNA